MLSKQYHVLFISLLFAVISDARAFYQSLPEETYDYQIPDQKNIAMFNALIKQLRIKPIDAVSEQCAILEKLTDVLIKIVQEHALCVLQNINREIQSIEYAQYYPIKSLVTQPTALFKSNAKKRYKQLGELRTRYCQLVGSHAQLERKNYHDIYAWLNHIVGTISQVDMKQSDAQGHTHKEAQTYKEALKNLALAGQLVQANDALLCMRTQGFGRLMYKITTPILPLSACAGGGYLISSYCAHLNTPDIAGIKQHYKNTVRTFHRQYVIPPINGQPVTDAMINAAAENLDTNFLEDHVIPAITTRIRTVPNWMPALLARAANARRQWMPPYVEAFLARIPARTIGVVATLMWLTDKTICDILPMGIETVVGLTALGGVAAFADRIVAVADAVITAAGGLSATPDMGMLLGLVYKKKLKLAVLKYGGGVLGFLGLYSLYRAAKKYNATSFHEYITHNVHGIVSVLAPYAGDVTGYKMKAEDVGMMLHYVDEIKDKLYCVALDTQRMFARDLDALQNMNTCVHNRIQLINSIYNLAATAV